MSNAQHTPGPLSLMFAVEGERADSIFVCSREDNGGLKAIAEVFGGDERLARLMKAAPELFEVLTRWLPYIEGQEGKSDETDILVDKARAAIAKAKGERS